MVWVNFGEFDDADGDEEDVEDAAVDAGFGILCGIHFGVVFVLVGGEFDGKDEFAMSSTTGEEIGKGAVAAENDKLFLVSWEK
jgi:hypothetical protein